jgi:hypothetical protein
MSRTADVSVRRDQSTITELSADRGVPARTLLHYWQNVPTIVPVPSPPPFGAYPELTCTTTIFNVVPEMMLPDFVALVVTRTPMKDGTTTVGGGLLPPEVDHGPPHADGGVLVGNVTVPAKPLNADGAGPPERTFTFDQELPHHVIVPPPAALTSPRRNAPRLGNANTTAVALAADGR